jgi:multicomponent Na+:H+ antiporter subunit C
VEPVIAVTVGVLYATGLFMLLRRSLAKLLIGIALITNGANLLILTSGGLQRAASPLLSDGIPNPVADPLPQALILTAIVISFGVLAFAITLLYRAYQSVQDDDLDRMQTTDKVEDTEPLGDRL